MIKYKYNIIKLWQVKTICSFYRRKRVHLMSEKGKIRFISEDKTKELQKDWKGYGRSQVLFGLVVLAIIILAVIYQFVL